MNKLIKILVLLLLAYSLNAQVDNVVGICVGSGTPVFTVTNQLVECPIYKDTLTGDVYDLLSVGWDKRVTPNADLVLIDPITGINASNSQEAFEDLKLQLDGVVASGGSDGVLQNVTVTGSTVTFNRTIGSNIVRDFSSIDTKLSDGDIAGFGYIKTFTEVDGSTTNELQNLTLSSNNLSLTNSAVNIDLSPYLDNTNLTEAQVDAFVSDNGYLSNESDPTVANHIKSITTSDIATWDLGEQNIQSDWGQTITSEDNYIKNKPDISTDANGSLIINFAGGVVTMLDRKVLVRNQTTGLVETIDYESDHVNLVTPIDFGNGAKTQVHDALLDINKGLKAENIHLQAFGVNAFVTDKVIDEYFAASPTYNGRSITTFTVSGVTGTTGFADVDLLKNGVVVTSVEISGSNINSGLKTQSSISLSIPISTNDIFTVEYKNNTSNIKGGTVILQIKQL